MPDAARPATDLLCPGLAARRLAGGLRQFLSLDRRMPTCQLSPGSDMRRIRSDQLWASQRQRTFAAGMEGLASIPDTRRQLLARIAAIGGRPDHRGDGSSPVTGHQGGRPWRVLWLTTGRQSFAGVP
jgi:hypothetical protein